MKVINPTENSLINLRAGNLCGPGNKEYTRNHLFKDRTLQQKLIKEKFEKEGPPFKFEPCIREEWEEKDCCGLWDGISRKCNCGESYLYWMMDYQENDADTKIIARLWK